MTLLTPENFFLDFLLQPLIEFVRYVLMSSEFTILIIVKTLKHIVIVFSIKRKNKIFPKMLCLWDAGGVGGASYLCD